MLYSNMRNTYTYIATDLPFFPYPQSFIFYKPAQTSKKKKSLVLSLSSLRSSPPSCKTRPTPPLAPSSASHSTHSRSSTPTPPGSSKGTKAFYLTWVFRVLFSTPQRVLRRLCVPLVLIHRWGCCCCCRTFYVEVCCLGGFILGVCGRWNRYIVFFFGSQNFHDRLW